MQPMSLKVLADKVLQRNSSATSEEIKCNHPTARSYGKETLIYLGKTASGIRMYESTDKSDSSYHEDGMIRCCFCLNCIGQFCKVFKGKFDTSRWRRCDHYLEFCQ